MLRGRAAHLPAPASTSHRPRAVRAVMLTGLLAVALLSTGLVSPLVPAGADQAPTEPRGHTCLLADRTEHNFGIAAQNTKVETTFTITNDSRRKVEGIRVKPGCGCNVVELAKDNLEPGESTELKVGFETSILSGNLLKTVRISSRKPSQGEIRLRLRIGILAGVVLEPGSVTFRDARHGTQPATSFLVRWFEGVGKPFKITAIQIPGHEDAFTTKVEAYTPLTRQAHQKPDMWRGYRVHLAFTKPPPLGSYSAELIVRTDNEKSKRLVLSVYANVVGQVWIQNRTLHFGIVEAGSTRRATTKFRPMDKDVAFGEVRAESTDPRIEVIVRPDPDPMNQRNGVWILTARIKEQSDAGRLDDAVIRVHTGAPGEETSEIRVQGTVRERKG